jgi:hypothetical protein
MLWAKRYKGYKWILTRLLKDRAIFDKNVITDKRQNCFVEMKIKF